MSMLFQIARSMGRRPRSARRPVRRSAAPALLTAAVAITIAGCSQGPRNFENENDRLRRRVMELSEKSEELSSRVEALEKRLEIEKERKNGKLPEGLQRPVCTNISLGRFSGGVDTDGDGRDDAVRLYIKTRDHRDRFVQTIARASASVVAIPPGKEAVTVGSTEVDAEAFDAAYRSGLFRGNHYTVTVPITKSIPDGVQELTARVGLHDLLTGRDHEAEKTIQWTPQQPDSDTGQPDGETG